MKAKHIIALILVVCLCLPVFASCDGGSEELVRNPDDTSNTSDPGFKSADYGDEDFTFFTLTTATSTHEYYCGAWIDSDELNGTATNDAVYKRNKTAEEKYRIKITEKKGKDGGMEELRSYYMANDYCFDVIYSWGSRLGPVVTDNLFYDFRALDDAGYINLENAYWSPESLEDLTIAGRTFLAINDITMSKLSWSGCMFYNPSIIADYNLEDPQDLVTANKWTLDKFLEMVGQVSYDLDKDGSFTKEDLYGFISFGGDPTGLLYGSGVTCTNKEADGTYTLAIGDTKVIDLIGKIKDTLNNSKNVFTQEQINNGADMTGYDEWEYTRSYFAKGHSLFLGGTPEITREFTSMENGYGIVPTPKYDDKQEKYISTVDANAGMFAIPNTVRTDGVSSASLERTGTILEYLAYKSSQEGGVMDAYYETTIKGQRMTIEKNKEMLDIIKTAGRYEWSDLILGDDARISKVLGEMYEKNGPASRYQQSKNRLTKTLNDTYDKFLNLN